MPFRSPLFRKLLVSAFALIAITILVLDFYLTRFTAQRETHAVEELLSSTAHILAGEMARVEPAAAENWSREAGGARMRASP